MAGKDSEDGDNGGSEEKNKLQIKAHDLEVKMESTEPLQKMVRMGSQEMDRIMKQSMRGELEVMEERDATFILGGE